MASALISRFIPIVIFPYYIALGSQILAALYAFAFIPETLHAQDKEDDLGNHESDDEEEQEMTVTENLVAPVKPLALLLPHRDRSTGVFHWKLFILTISLFTTTSGVRYSFISLYGELRCVDGIYSDCLIIVLDRQVRLHT